MNQSSTVNKKILFSLCYLIAIGFSIKSFREPDLWWQIRTGQWILQHHSVPQFDVFSFTFYGIHWINIKWGFEVVSAFVSNFIGIESVFIIQAFVTCLILFFLLKLSSFFLQKTSKSDETTYESAYLFSTAIALIITFVGIEYRMIGRPEMISHLMTVIFLFILEKYRRSRSKIIYFIIPLQIFWANFHEAFGIGIIILLIYTASSWIEKIAYQNKVSGNRSFNPVQLSLVTVGAIASVAINPNGLRLVASPISIMSQVFSNKYTTELLNVTSSGWWQKEAWIGLFIFSISILGLFKNAPTDSKKRVGNWKMSNIMNSKAYLLLILAFFYLSLTAYRNLIFLCLVCFPSFHSSLFGFFKKLFQNFSGIKKTSFVMSITLLISFYILIVTDQYYRLSNSRDHFGLEVLSNYNPVGAAHFVQENKLQQKKCFADYLTSSYLLFKLQPDFKTFIDLRDLDVFPPDFFNKFFEIVNDPQQFHKLDSLEHFDYVVLYQGQFPALHSYLYNDSIYALKYVDAVTAVYEKTDTFSKEDIFSSCQTVKQGSFAIFVNKLLNPFYKPFNYAEMATDYMAASYYLNVSRYDLSIKRAEKCIDDKKIAYKGYGLLGQIYYTNASNTENTKEKRNELLATAEDYYLRSLRLKKDYGHAYLGLGVIYYSRENYRVALNYFNKCNTDKEVGEQAIVFSEECRKALGQ